MKASDAIFSAFEKHFVVALGDSHGLAQEEDFYSVLLRDPRFAREVGNVIVEFGDAAQQGVVDRYVAGDSVPYPELRKVWADNIGWYPTVTSVGYINFFATVREVNAKLPPQQRIRVWLGDPPVDWSKVKTEAEVPETSRDETPANLIVTEILGKQKKSLVIYGFMHFRGRGSIRERVEQTYPGTLYIIHPYTGFLEEACSDHFEGNLGVRPDAVILSPVKGTTVEAQLRADGCHFTSARSVAFPPGYTEAQKAHTRAELEEGHSGASADALLYLGPAKTLTLSPDSPDLYMDTAYRAEIKRRVQLMGPGEVNLPNVDANTVSPRHLQNYSKQ